jgi:starch-binding outer membrane protein, SusD/RagB family
MDGFEIMRRSGGSAGCRTGALRWALALPLAAMLTVGCDLSVVNPGPVNDTFLDDAAAHTGMVNGAGRALSDGLNWSALTGGGVSREIVGAGNLIAHGINLNQRQGRLLPTEVNDQWNRAQRARWVSENTLARMKENLGTGFNNSALGARALVYAGYANRLLGENFCDAVFDGGPKEPRARYFERAEAHFTEALTVAAAANQTALVHAARAGRAAARVWLNKWDDAVADASAVPAGFVYLARMTQNNVDEYNRIQWATANQPFRTISVINTFYNDYYTQTRDPRVPWDLLPGFPFGDSGNPPVPFHRQRKYTERSSGIRLASFDEMRLIRAEALLRGGNWEAGLQLLNERRLQLGLDPWTADSSAEAWARLKRERGIELWLEGRRLGDLWRWRNGQTPGANPDDTGQDACIPIAQAEIDTNPNL